jgi:hypothetical protein
MTSFDPSKKKFLTAIVFIVVLIVCGFLFNFSEPGRSAIKAIGSVATALIAGFIGVTFVLAPVFIWLGGVVGILAAGIYLILWSFKIYKPIAHTKEQALRMEIRYKKYNNVAKVLGFVLIGLVVYYFIR